MNAKVFIASASESEGLANAVHALLIRHVQSHTWRQGSFALSGYPVNSLLKKVSEADFAVFICQGTDRIVGRDAPGAPDRHPRFVVRDNVLFELGMFISALGMDRTFILVPETGGPTMPSDLSGVTFANIRMDHPNLEAAVQPACDRILQCMRALGPRSAQTSTFICSSADEFAKYLAVKGRTKIIAHCDHDKWGHGGFLAPGSRIGNEIKSLGANRPELTQLTDPPGSTADWQSQSNLQTLFLVDSPYFNPYTRHVLDHYQEYVTGGCIGYSIHTGSNEIHVGATRYQSNKHPAFSGQLVGRFSDYLLLMRLPGEAAGTDDNEGRVVWLMYGLTTKGSHAGACLFQLENFRKFESWRHHQANQSLPEYFEAVFKVSELKEKVEDFADLEVKHFAALRPHRKRFAGDPIPPNPERFFVRGDGGGGFQGDAPICSVHLDLVAGCNFKCPTCIEKDARDRNLFLSTRKVCQILIDLRRTGCRDLRFYGGEPTLHPDFAAIVDLALELGFEMMLVTNGSRLGDPRIAGALIRAADAGRMHVRVSLDANTPETHAAHHACAEDEFPRIVLAMTNLIDRGVPVSISYLLTNKSLPELERACRFWSRKKAEAFLPRIMMDVHGQWRKPDDLVRTVIKEVIRTHQKWVVAPPWLERWLEHAEPMDGTSADPEQVVEDAQNRFSLCYTGAFRLVISPYQKDAERPAAAQGDEAESIPADATGPSTPSSAGKGSDDAAPLVATDDAWISVCPYFRYHRPTGCEYPEDFSKWCKSNRVMLLDNIRMNGGVCTGLVCSRAGMNAEVEEALKAGLS